MTVSSAHLQQLPTLLNDFSESVLESAFYTAFLDGPQYAVGAKLFEEES
jgi:hypothetical protein